MLHNIYITTNTNILNMITETTLEAYLTALDRAQAYEICVNEYKLVDAMELRRELTQLHRLRTLNDESNLIEHIEKVNEYLDNLISSCDSQTQEKIKNFLQERRTAANVNEGLLKRIAEEADRLNKIVASVNRSVTREHSEHTCIICNEKFPSVSKHSVYCSPKCRQAAYRERKR